MPNFSQKTLRTTKKPKKQKGCVCAFFSFFLVFLDGFGKTSVFFGELRKYDNIFRFLFLLFDSRNLAETDCCLKVCPTVERVGGRVRKTDSSAVFKSKERIYAKNFSPLSFFFGGRFLRALWLEMLEIAITLRHCVFFACPF